MRDRRAKPALERFRSPPLPARCSSKKQIHPFGGPYLVDGELAHAAKFTGKDLDEDTGLYYFNARWYDSEVGRFVSKDPYSYLPNDERIIGNQQNENFVSKIIMYGILNPKRQNGYVYCLNDRVPSQGTHS